MSISSSGEELHQFKFVFYYQRGTVRSKMQDEGAFIIRIDMAAVGEFFFIGDMAAASVVSCPWYFCQSALCTPANSELQSVGRSWPGRPATSFGLLYPAEKAAASWLQALLLPC